MNTLTSSFRLNDVIVFADMFFFVFIVVGFLVLAAVVFRPLIDEK